LAYQIDNINKPEWSPRLFTFSKCTFSVAGQYASINCVRELRKGSDALAEIQGRRVYSHDSYLWERVEIWAEGQTLKTLLELTYAEMMHLCMKRQED
jgi:hypothetical protein